MIDKANIRRNLSRLMAAKSISGTAEEIQGAEVILDMLRELDYFKAHSENIFTVPVAGDPLGRYIVAALMCGGGAAGDTVILTGHYDVVDTDEFAQLKDIAFDMDAITARIGELPMSEECRQDYESGDWLFGRGSADMKFGHALIIELLRHYSEDISALSGNLLYVAVCGEETNSEGMLTAAPFLNKLAAERNLHYRALLLSECYLNDDMAHDPTRYIHYGATGKVMPLFFCAGKGCHADEPFVGLDANALNAAVYARLAMNTDYCEHMRGECTPPAVCLKMKDLKANYSVSIPMYAVSYYSLLTLDLDPEGITERLKALAYDAFTAVLEKRRQDMRRYGQLMPRPIATRDFEPNVITYAELYAAVKAEQSDIDARLASLARTLTEQKTELQDVSIELVRCLYEQYSDKRPTIIIAFIPPYYPDVYMDTSDADAHKLLCAAENIIAYAEKEFGEKLALKDYYMGLSDMSYTGLSEEANHEALFNNLAGANITYSFPMQALKALHVPGIVLGGWGKDFHQSTERLNVPYSFGVVPALYIRIIDYIFNK
ncbi:MAG: M20/M25/M40 family metallo-hydrolase [Eubacteriales bacterium]|nr:M20/M25/M40 family metallo-hydrolase [Eubacteriales bacterium]